MNSVLSFTTKERNPFEKWKFVNMKTLTINLPEEVNENEIKMAVAAILFDKGVLSSGQAAEFAGISKRVFIETVGKYGVSIFGETSEDIKAPFSE
jgi:predicted HTH domain antitoxin